MNTCKKLFLLTTVVMLLGMAGSASATVWWDGSSSNDWDTAANWSNSAVPTSADNLRIADNKTPYPVIDSGTTAYASGFYVSYNNNSLTVYGTLTTYSGSVKIGHSAGTTGTLYIKSGANVTIGKPDIFIGYDGNGTLDMDGGTLNAEVHIGYRSGSTGHVQLDGGTINAATFDMRLSGGTGTMDIEAGTLIINGDVASTINGYVTSGYITAYDGSGTVNVDYNVTNAGKTTVTGTAPGGGAPDQVTGASPSDGATNQAITVDISWSAASGADDYDVYFGTDSTPDSGELKGNQAGLSYEPGTLSNATTYYWQIDSNNATGTTTGNVWSFTTVVATPAQVTGASPSDGATNQAITVDISWSAASGATSYDVYFGESSPGTSQGNQAPTSYEPGSLSNDTTYYWRIDSVNVGGTTAGNVWSFTTIIAAPAQVTGASPADAATNQAITVDLSWSAASGATSYDVYFGESSPGTSQGNQAGTSYEPGSLSNDTTYYWRIDSVNVGGTTGGNVWSFTTVAASLPDQVTGASPADAATNQAVNADLSWSAASGADNYDVYFGETSPGTSQGNQAATGFDTGSMDNDTTYYWRIDSNNTAGMTTGNVWSFTTVVAAPAQVTGASPADAATNQAITVDISWSAATGASNYDVYFGTDATPDSSELQGNQAGLSYEPGSLSNDTTYYWRIDSNNVGGTTAGNVWSFTTIVAAPAQVTGASPSDGATSQAVTVDISWSAASGASNYDVYFGTDSTPDSGELKGNQAAVSYEPGSLSNETTYYWRIDSNNVAGMTTGNVWSFTTESEGSAEIALDASSNSSGGSNTTTRAWSHTVGSGSNRVLVVGYAGRDNDDVTDLNVSGVTLGSDDFTYVSNSGINAGSTSVKVRTELWYLLDPASGTDTITITTTDTVDYIVGGAISLENVKQQAAEAVVTNSDQTYDSPASISTNITTQTDGAWVIDLVGMDRNQSFSTTTSGMTEQWEQGSANKLSGASSYKSVASAGPTTMSWTNSKEDVHSKRLTHSLAAFEPASGGGPQPPAEASNPSPADGATNESAARTLSWTADSSATDHDVYFGTDSTPDSGEFQGNQATAIFDPGTMDNVTTYYWRIDSNNSAGMTTGSVWSFTTIVAGPNQVSNPSPADGATDVSATADLSWSAGTGATNYNVYLGTDSTPDSGELKGNQTALSYDPGTLTNNTTYYWRVDSNNIAGTTTGPVWSFTVITTAPAAASNPNPADAATAVAISADLSWSATGADNYDVYFGTSSPGTSQGNVTPKFYDPGTMDNDTTYYWRIDANNSAGMTTGSVWSFTTVDTPGPNDSNLIGWWTFNESSGSSAADSTSYDNDGTLINMDASDWVTGLSGNALDFDGVDDAVQISTSDMDVSNGTVAMWVYPHGFTSKDFMFGHTSQPPWANRIQLYCHSDGQLDVGMGNNYEVATNVKTLSTDQWYHIALTWNGSTFNVYVDGTNESNGSYSGLTTLSTYADIGNTGYRADSSESFYGIIDDVRLYNHVLDVDDIAALVAMGPGEGQARNPYPVDNSVAVDQDVDLSWTAGDYVAATNGHDVYFGTSFSDVNAGTGGTSMGLQTATTFDPNTLTYGETYYWAVDEVNDGNTWYGDVWNFTVMNPVFKATSPSPFDGAQYIDPNADLAWTAGDFAASHDVYFGTDPTPDGSESQGNQSATTFDPGTMDTNTIYYWRIDEVNSPDTWTGDVWSFKTGAAPQGLGDLQVPANRIPTWNPGVEGGVPDTSGWNIFCDVTDSPYNAVANDGQLDRAAIQSAIDAANAAGGNQVVYVPAGTFRGYAHGSGNTLNLKSNVVLRGAGRDLTTITGDRGGGPEVWGGVHLYGSGGAFVNITTSSLPRGTTTITLANASGFSVGDYCMMKQDNDMSYFHVRSSMMSDEYLRHIFKVSAKNGNTLTMDRPLRHYFGASFNPRVQKMNPISNSGLEDMKVMCDELTLAQWQGGLYANTGPVGMYYAVNCWIDDCYLYCGYRKHIHAKYSSRCTIRDSKFYKMLQAEYGDPDDGSEKEYDAYCVLLHVGAVDFLVTNNIFIDHYVDVIMFNGANGNVASYNYHIGPRGLHGFFFHGRYPHENLFEGNQTDASITVDNWWGEQGPRNTIFRNRLVDTGWVKNEDYHSSTYHPTGHVADQLNVIGNIAWSYRAQPFCQYEAGSCRDYDTKMTNLWLERNIYRDYTRGDHYGLILRTPEPTTTNLFSYGGDKAPASWSTFNMPASLYLTQKPDWWPSGKPWPCTGSDIDDFTGTLTKLPAQDRYESEQ